MRTAHTGNAPVERISINIPNQSKSISMERAFLLHGVRAVGFCLVALFSACHSEHAGHSESKEDAGHEAGEIIVEPETAQRFGIKVDTVRTVALREMVTATGELQNSSSGQSVASARTAGIVRLAPGVQPGKHLGAGAVIANISADRLSGGNPNEAARVAVEAAKRELERLRPLLKEGIVTRREYNAAEAAYESARAGYVPSGKASAVVASTAGVIAEVFVTEGQFVDVGAPIASISSGMNLTLRVDIPERLRMIADRIEDAGLRRADGSGWVSIGSLDGRRIMAPTSQTPSRGGYFPVYFSLENDGSLAPGSYVEVCLYAPTRKEGIALPRQAITEQQGAYFVYVQTGDHSYEKRRVGITDAATPEVVVESGLTPGERVVVEGTAIVRLSEGGAQPEAHSHQH